MVSWPYVGFLNQIVIDFLSCQLFFCLNLGISPLKFKSAVLSSSVDPVGRIACGAKWQDRGDGVGDHRHHESRTHGLDLAELYWAIHLLQSEE